MNCDAIARWYRLLEYLVFGKALEGRRCRFLDRVCTAKRVLILGDGDGRFTAAFLRRNAIARVESIDLSAGMLRLAQRRLPDKELTRRVEFREEDARTAELTGAYDLIVSHFFLDCFRSDEVNRLIARLAQKTAPGSLWLISEFGVPMAEPFRTAGRLLIRVMYFFFGLATDLTANELPDYAGALRHHGFTKVEESVAARGLLVSEVWQRI